MDSLSEFLAFLSSVDCQPEKTSDISQTSKLRRYSIAGDKGQKTGWYIFEDKGHFTSGIVGNWRTGEKHIFKGSLTKLITEEERNTAEKKRKADRVARYREEKKQHEQVADKCLRLYKEAAPAIETHPYIVKKQIKPLYIKQSGDLLLIPLYADGKLWNLQTIAPDGKKRFKFGGRKKGCYHALADKGEDLSTIVVVEGYSTGVSIRTALGLPVVVAFDAGNLEPVCDTLKNKYKDARIIIGADNDHLKEFNTGLNKAAKLSEKYDIEYSAPDFAPDDTGTDWNDAGIDKIKETFYINIKRGVSSRPALLADNQDDTDTPAPPLDWLENAPPIEEYENDTMIPIESAHSPQAQEFEYNKNWKADLLTDDKGGLLKTMSLNAGLIIENSDMFRNMFCYDEFSHRKLVVQCPPWESAKKFRPRDLIDEDITNLNYCLQKFGLKIPANDLRRCLDAALLKKRRNPAKEYMKSLKWDNVPRLGTWLKYYCGAEEDDEEYLSIAGTMWMVACVTRVFRPGAKFDHMLILEGRQGARKSTLLKELATIHGNPYFTDSVSVDELGTLNGIMKMQGCLIVEFAEMTGLGKSSNSKMKQHISLDVDTVRLNYKNETSDFPRQFVMAGTINPENGYLDDPTGGRRFWPVKVGNKIDVEAIAHDKEQLWAEAVYLYEKGYKIFINEDQRPLFEHAQEARTYIDSWFEVLKDEAGLRDFVANEDLHRAVSTDKTRWDKRMSNRLANVMTMLGYENGREGSGRRRRGWVKKDD